MRTAVSLLVVLATLQLGAQQTEVDSSRPLRRVWLAGSVTYHQGQLTEGLNRTLTGSMTIRPFEHEGFQLAAAPFLSAYNTPIVNGVLNGVNGGGGIIADYGWLVPFGIHAYVGGIAEGYDWTRGYPHYYWGAHAGLFTFVTPSAALRLEVRREDWSSPSFGPLHDVFLSLDPYLIRNDAIGASIPRFGIVEAAGAADVNTDPFQTQSASVTFAPFLTSWLQVGTDLGVQAQSQYTGTSVDGFVRLYAPLSPVFMPFVGGTVASSTTGNFDGGLSSYSGTIGFRHGMDRAMAADVGVRWTATPHLFPDQLSLFAKLVLQLDLRRPASSAVSVTSPR